MNKQTFGFACMRVCRGNTRSQQQRHTRGARCPLLLTPAHRRRALALPFPLHRQQRALAAPAAAAAASDLGAAASALTGAAAAAAAGSPGVQLAAEGPMDLWWPLCMSLLAGLSTSIGGLLAVTLSPDEGTLAFLLGAALGVMACVSGVELWWHSAAQLGDWIGVSAAVLGGAALFAVLDPLLPKPPETEELLEAQQPLTAQQQQETSGNQPASSSQHHAPHHHDSSTSSSSDVAQPAAAAGAASPLLQAAAPGLSSSTALQQADVRRATDSSRNVAPDTRPEQTQKPAAFEMQNADAVVDIQPPRTPSSSSSDSKPGAHRQKSLLRLSLLMTITLTLHNLPEGFAVAFSAFTDIGWIMVLAIGLHNVPEGLICAAPLYAATRSKWKAVGVATASGLSEPLGALLALLVFKPFVKSVAALDYVMAATGGVMLAVCVLELWPEGRRCGQDGRLLGGILLGTAVMAWTLYVGA